MFLDEVLYRNLYQKANEKQGALPLIFVLDDVTSAVDMETEKKELLEEIFKNVNSVIVKISSIIRNEENVTTN